MQPTNPTCGNIDCSTCGGAPVTHHQLDELRISTLTAERDQLRDALAVATKALERNRQGYLNILEMRKLDGAIWGQRDGYGGRYGALTREEIEEVIAEIDVSLQLKSILAERSRREKLEAEHTRMRKALEEIAGTFNATDGRPTHSEIARAALDGTAAQEQGK